MTVYSRVVLVNRLEYCTASFVKSVCRLQIRLTEANSSLL